LTPIPFDTLVDLVTMVTGRVWADLGQRGVRQGRADKGQAQSVSSYIHMLDRCVQLARQVCSHLQWLYNVGCKENL